jgi:hypothetical protein
MGLSCLRNRPLHPRGNPAAQGGFKKVLPSTLQTIAAQHPEVHLQLWCQDEVRFGKKGRTTRVWSERGVRPPGIVDQRFESLYLFPVYRPGTDETFALALPRVNADAMTLFLKHFSRQLEPGVHAVLILDQAGWHDERALHVAVTNTLLPLPPASPQLNPVERVWLYMRERYLSHRMLNDYEAVLGAVCRAWSGSSTRQAISQY